MINKNKMPFYPMFDYLTESVKEQPFSSEAIHAAKRHILNTIGVIVAATDQKFLNSIYDFADKSEKGNCTILCLDSGYSPATAALYNGIAAHSLDMDDCSCTMNTHPSAVFIPALLAVAEHIGASGKQFLNAFVGGTVVGTYIGDYCGELVHKAGWHPTGILMPPAAALACGILLDFTKEQFLNVFGAAASLACGLRANFGSDTKALHVGIAAQNAVLAALFETKGMTSSKNAIAGFEGFLSQFCGVEYSEEKAEEIAVGLSGYEIVDPGYILKQFPSCSNNHQATCALYDILEEYPQITANDVEGIDIYLSEQALVELVTPHPTSPSEARFSPGFHMALALLGEKIEPKNFTVDVINKPEVQRIIHATKLIHAPEFDKIPGVTRWPACVVLKLKDGREIRKMRLYADGDMACPFTDDKLKEMYYDCVKDQFDDNTIQKQIDTIFNIESLDDIHELTALFI